MVDDGVTCLDRTSCDLGEEGLVSHVGQWVNNGDLGLALAEELFELPGGVEAGVAAANNQNLGHSNTSPVNER